MTLQTLQEILKSKIENPSVLHRVDELREMGIKVEMLPIEQSMLLENLTGKLPRKMLSDGIEYVTQLPEEIVLDAPLLLKTKAKNLNGLNFLQATVEILGILPDDAALFTYRVPVRNPKKRYLSSPESLSYM